MREFLVKSFFTGKNLHKAGAALVVAPPHRRLRGREVEVEVVGVTLLTSSLIPVGLEQREHAVCSRERRRKRRRRADTHTTVGETGACCHPSLHTLRFIFNSFF